jgi:hypothetical protein
VNSKSPSWKIPKTVVFSVVELIAAPPRVRPGVICPPWIWPMVPAAVTGPAIWVPKIAPVLGSTPRKLAPDPPQGRPVQLGDPHLQQHLLRPRHADQVDDLGRGDRRLDLERPALLGRGPPGTSPGGRDRRVRRRRGSGAGTAPGTPCCAWPWTFLAWPTWTDCR